MSNNIYDILKKMQNLESPKQTLTESKKAKPDYIDIDKDGNKTEPMKKAAKEKSKGAVAEAVARVEQQLAGKYQGWKKINEEEKMIRKVIPVGVIDGPGGYDEAQKRIQDYEAGKINKRGEPLPPIEDRSRPAEKPKTNVGRKEVDEDSVRLMQRGFDPYFGAPSGDLDMEREMRPQDDIELKRYRTENPLPKGPGTTVDDYALDRRNLEAAMLYDKYNRAQQLARDRNDLSLSQWAEKGMNKIKSLVTGKPEQPVSYQAYRFDKPGPFGSATARDEIAPPPMKEGEMDESALQAYLGKKKYGKEGMQALQKAGRDGASKEKMARIRAQHDKMDEGAMELTPDEIKASEKELYRRNYGDKGYFGSKDPRVAGYQEFINRTSKLTGSPKIKVDGMYGPRTAEATQSTDNFFLHSGRKHPAAEEYWKHHHNITQHAYDDVANGVTRNPLGNVKEEMIDEGEYNEDMLSPKDKEFAALAEPKDKITYADKIAGAKQGKKTEGNRFTAGLANDNVKVGDKIPGTNAVKTKDIDEGQSDGPEYQAAWKRTQDERKAWEKSNPDKKYYDQGPAERHSMELATARDADRAAKDKTRGPLGRVANTLSRGLFGQELPEGRTSMREGWEEMQKYLEKKRGPESKGGAGKKAGTRYGGSAQRDDDEETDGEGQAVVKKKGRPKGTGGGAKFNFKKPKD